MSKRDVWSEETFEVLDDSGRWRLIKVFGLLMPGVGPLVMYNWCVRDHPGPGNVGSHPLEHRARANAIKAALTYFVVQSALYLYVAMALLA